MPPRQWRAGAPGDDPWRWPDPYVTKRLAGASGMRMAIATPDASASIPATRKVRRRMAASSQPPSLIRTQASLLGCAEPKNQIAGIARRARFRSISNP